MGGWAGGGEAGTSTATQLRVGRRISRDARAITYVGHATVLIELDGVRLLTDPVLRERFLLLSRASAPPAAGTADEIDAALISHMHADHLDPPSLRELGHATRLSSRRGVSKMLERRGLSASTELEPGMSVGIGPVTVTATRAVHDARRWKVGPARTAVGYLVESPTACVYFAGDTDLFDEMEELRGKVDVALLPIGGWGPTIGDGHLDPAPRRRGGGDDRAADRRPDPLGHVPARRPPPAQARDPHRLPEAARRRDGRARAGDRASGARARRLALPLSRKRASPRRAFVGGGWRGAGAGVLRDPRRPNLPGVSGENGTGGLTVLIMAAGEGTRMRSSLPKVLHTVCGRPMVAWPVLAARDAGADRVAVIVSPDRDLAPGLPEHTETVVQQEADGTGGAVRAAHDVVRESDTVVVLSGDHPLITGEIVAGLLETHRAAGAGATVMTVELDDPGAYGRIVRDADGDIERIVETKQPQEVAPEELAIREINTGTYVFDAEPLVAALDGLAQRQLRRRVLPRRRAADCLREQGRRIVAHTAGDPNVNLGVNNRADLAAVTAEARRQILERHMLAGVTIADPASTWIDADVEIAADVTIEPGTSLHGATVVGCDTIIGPHSTITDSRIGEGAPDRPLRPRRCDGRPPLPGRPVQLPAPRRRARATAPRRAPSSRSRTR